MSGPSKVPDWNLLTVERDTDFDVTEPVRKVERETFGVYVWSEEFPPGWVCKAVCDTPKQVTKHVHAYQEIHLGRRRIKIDRCGGIGECGYCGYTHEGKCKTDTLGNPA